MAALFGASRRLNRAYRPAELARERCLFGLQSLRYFSVLSKRWLGRSEFNSGARPRILIILHGILGSKSNWATPTKRMLETGGPLGWQALLLDHRGHGLSPGGEAPHDVDACAKDVLDTLLADGVPIDDAELVICGHSFGGKVALAFTKSRLEAGKLPPRMTWIFDSMPGCLRRDEKPTAKDQLQNPGFVIPVIEAELAAGATYVDRNALVNTLESKYNMLRPVAQWIGQTVRKTSDESIEFSYDITAVRALHESYANTDMWHMLEDGHANIGVVVAGKNRKSWGEESLARLGQCGPSVRTHIMENAGHNVHVDDLPGLLRIMEPTWK